MVEPRFLTRTEAAHYVGVGETLFMQEVAMGIWPQPRMRGTKGGRLTWDRKLLDAFADRDSGLHVGRSAEIPVSAATEPDNVVPLLSERMNATLPKRTERRAQETRGRVSP